MSLPTEDEIRATAKFLGLADEHGNYRQRDRAKIAAAVHTAQRETDAAADPETGNTAEILGRLDTEMCTHGIGSDARARVLAVAAAHLLKTAGLNLKPREETTP
jgi:hypothetical protein